MEELRNHQLLAATYRNHHWTSRQSKMAQESNEKDEGQDIAGRPGYKKLANGIILGPDGKP